MRWSLWLLKDRREKNHTALTKNRTIYYKHVQILKSKKMFGHVWQMPCCWHLFVVKVLWFAHYGRLILSSRTVMWCMMKSIYWKGCDCFPDCRFWSGFQCDTVTMDSDRWWRWWRWYDATLKHDMILGIWWHPMECLFFWGDLVIQVVEVPVPLREERVMEVPQVQSVPLVWCSEKRVETGRGLMRTPHKVLTTEFRY